jgi:hypothetical protein
MDVSDVGRRRGLCAGPAVTRSPTFSTRPRNKRGARASSQMHELRQNARRDRQLCITPAIRQCWPAVLALSNVDSEPSGRAETAAQPMIARASGDADTCAGLDDRQQRPVAASWLLLRLRLQSCRRHYRRRRRRSPRHAPARRADRPGFPSARGLVVIGLGACFARRLSHKPVQNLVHQLVDGITLSSADYDGHSTGTGAANLASLGQFLPPSLEQ